MNTNMLNRDKYEELLNKGMKKEEIRSMYNMTDYSFRQLVKSFRRIEKQADNFVRVNEVIDMDYILSNNICIHLCQIHSYSPLT